MGPLMRATFDTNLLIDYLNGIRKAADEIARYSEPAISRITWMEVLVGARDKDEAFSIRQFLRLFNVIEINEAIADKAVAVRQSRKMRLPDAIIYATADCYGGLLITRNTRDFPASDPLIRVPYRR